MVVLLMNTRILLIIALSLSWGTFLARAADADAKTTNASPTRVDPLKKYDKNGDGKLDDKEKAELQKDREAARKEYMAQLLKKYDKNGNGKLDEDELAARREDLRKEREAELAKRENERKQKEEKAKEPKEPAKEEKK
jgi:hypothetical protein